MIDAELVAVERGPEIRLKAFQELSTRARGQVAAHQVCPAQEQQSQRHYSADLQLTPNTANPLHEEALPRCVSPGQTPFVEKLLQNVHALFAALQQQDLLPVWISMQVLLSVATFRQQCPYALTLHVVQCMLHQSLPVGQWQNSGRPWQCSRDHLPFGLPCCS